MVSNYDVYGIREFVGKSTDSKPTVTADGFPVNNGSIFYEMDTKKFYMYDADTNTWIEQ